MMFRIHPGSGIPIYLQLEAQVKQSIAAGALAEGDTLPPVRRLAAELRINPNTVARAYQNLERDGVLRTVPGGGCYVNGEPVGLSQEEKVRRLRPMAEQLAVEAKQMRFAAEDALKLVEDAFRALGENRHGGEA